MYENYESLNNNINRLNENLHHFIDFLSDFGIYF